VDLSKLSLNMTAMQRYKSLNTFLNVLFALAFFRAVQFLPPFADKHWRT
jgi:hypothetical protein